MVHERPGEAIERPNSCIKRHLILLHFCLSQRYLQKSLTPEFPNPITLSRQTRNKLVTQGANALLEISSVASLPVSVVGHGAGAGEADVQDVLATVAVVAGYTAVGEAQLGQRNGRLADGVGAVGVAPDAVVLSKKEKEKSVSILSWRGRERRERAHQLPAAHDGHHAQRLHPVLLRIELGPVVAEHDVRVHVGVEVGDAVRTHAVLERRLRLARRVVGAVARALVRAVAVDVHVGVLPAVGLRVQEDGVGRDVAAVGEGVVVAADARGEAAEEFLGAFAGLWLGR